MIWDLGSGNDGARNRGAPTNPQSRPNPKSFSRIHGAYPCPPTPLTPSRLGVKMLTLAVRVLSQKLSASVSMPEEETHLLLVEDEDTVRAVAERALTRAGYADSFFATAWLSYRF